MSQLARLFLDVPKVARTLLDFFLALWVAAGIFVGPAHLERFQDWLWGPPPPQQEIVQKPPQLDADQEALLGQAYRDMATVFEVYRLAQKLQAPPAF